VSDHHETAFPSALIHVVSASSFFVPFLIHALCSNLKSCTTFQFQERSFLRHRGGKGAYQENCCRRISGHVRSWEEEGSSAPREDEDLHRR